MVLPFFLSLLYSLQFSCNARKFSLRKLNIRVNISRKSREREQGERLDKMNLIIIVLIAMCFLIGINWVFTAIMWWPFVLLRIVFIVYGVRLLMRFMRNVEG